ncbi:hypothetical protein AJ87_13570 [Rhizobium yanglingense]|nr:hypothetical protein AJ87_13570 [Rhizobium yanglingense]
MRGKRMIAGGRKPVRDALWPPWPAIRFDPTIKAFYTKLRTARSLAPSRLQTWFKSSMSSFFTIPALAWQLVWSSSGFHRFSFPVAASSAPRIAPVERNGTEFA